MAKNWTAAEAVEVIREGTDREAIQDIGRRFPIFAVMAGKGEQGLAEIVSSLPQVMTVRKIESQLKEAIEPKDDEGGEEEEEAEEKPKQKKKKKQATEGKKQKAAGGKKNKKKPEPEPEEDEEEEWDDEEEEEEEDDSLENKSLPELRKIAKKNKINIKGLKKKEQIIAAINGEDDEDEEWDEDEDDEDEWDL